MPTDYQFRYVQRLIRTGIGTDALATARFEEVYSTDNMGAAEYEFGAFVSFLRAMHEKGNPKDTRTLLDRWVRGVSAPQSKLVHFRAKVAGITVYGVFDSTKNTLDSVRNEIAHVAKGRAWLKRSAMFPPREGAGAGPFPITAWAEIKQNVIWSLHDLSHFGTWVANTMDFMAASDQQTA